MAVCPSFKIDSNDTGLRFAVEKCLKQLPTLADDGADPVWHPLEPNSYGDMGANVTTVARNPINPSRQRQKGVVTDLEATASFTMDLTGKNHLYMMQGFNFAHAREKPSTAKLNEQPIPITAVTAVDGYAVNNSFAAQIAVGDIILAEGFGVPANNGVKLVTATDVGEVLAAGLAAEPTPPADAKLTVVGVQGATGDLAITVGADVRLTATTLNLTTLGLLPGEWIFIGGDAANTYFSNNRGFARIGAIAPGYLILDKTSWTPQAQAGTGLDIQIFFGTVIRNEEDPDDIVRSTFQFERTLGRDANGFMSQYIIGSVANELTVNVAQADKVTAEMSFIACDAVARTGADGLKPGARPPLVGSADAFNTSSDVRRLAFTLEGQTTPLFVYATDLTLTIANNASGLKAVGVLGNMDVSVGTYDVGGSVTAYFQDVRAVNAVRNNESVSMDLVLVKNNIGIVWDIPLMTLGNGMVAVEQDQAITVPLDMTAAQSSFGHTLLYVNFPYLPNAA